MGCAVTELPSVQEYNDSLHERDEQKMRVSLTNVAATACSRSDAGRVDFSLVEDCFDRIQNIVRRNAPKFSYSCISVDLLSAEELDRELERCTECSAAANYMIQLLCGITNESVSQRRLDVLARRAPCTDEEFFGSYEKLMKVNSDGTYIHAVIEKLLTPSRRFQHQLFCVTISGGGHLLVIEKQAEECNTWWRIYQSWYSYFTLAEWIGVDPWKSDNTDFTTRHARFGNGKKLSHQEILYFFAHPMIDRGIIAKDINFYIRVFDIDINICSILQNKLIELGQKA